MQFKDFNLARGRWAIEDYVVSYPGIECGAETSFVRSDMEFVGFDEEFLDCGVRGGNEEPASEEKCYVPWYKACGDVEDKGGEKEENEDGAC